MAFVGRKGCKLANRIWTGLPRPASPLYHRTRTSWHRMLSQMSCSVHGKHCSPNAQGPSITRMFEDHLGHLVGVVEGM
jgi:hypothetical protein